MISRKRLAVELDEISGPIRKDAEAIARKATPGKLLPTPKLTEYFRRRK